MGMVDVATVLFKGIMRFDAADTHRFDRDRFIVSHAHGSMLLYSLLHLTGYQDMPIEDWRDSAKSEARRRVIQNIATQTASNTRQVRWGTVSQSQSARSSANAS